MLGVFPTYAVLSFVLLVGVGLGWTACLLVRHDRG